MPSSVAGVSTQACAIGHRSKTHGQINNTPQRRRTAQRARARGRMPYGDRMRTRTTPSALDEHRTRRLRLTGAPAECLHGLLAPSILAPGPWMAAGRCTSTCSIHPPRCRPASRHALVLVVTSRSSSRYSWLKTLDLFPVVTMVTIPSNTRYRAGSFRACDRPRRGRRGGGGRLTRAVGGPAYPCERTSPFRSPAARSARRPRAPPAARHPCCAGIGQ